jgi:hypothetical protein
MNQRRRVKGSCTVALCTSTTVLLLKKSTTVTVALSSILNNETMWHAELASSGILLHCKLLAFSIFLLLRHDGNCNLLRLLVCKIVCVSSYTFEFPTKEINS